ncbi:hypothetical protein Clacol_008762 [Clathrus columnatus]|uniref:Uncharacterized protein n=1 Tax=Clathrus columnatus TaxID=1419009 RepID=A0AAV5AN63_9AGAM|nr:hypothetical protein Clacol_008762 [Clathrus columnatus]
MNSIIAFGVPELAFQSFLVLMTIITVIRTCTSQVGHGTGSSLAVGLLVVIVQPKWLAGPAGQPSVQWSYVTFSITVRQASSLSH